MSEVLQYAVEQRLRLIDFLLHHYGSVSRVELKDYFGIGGATVTRDFVLYQRMNPDSIVLDPKSKRYMRSLSFQRCYP